MALGAVGVFAAFKLRKPPEPVFHQLVFGRGFIETARFTPDGQNVVYGASWNGKPFEIFTTGLDGLESRSLDLPPGEHPGHRRQRPDGDIAGHAPHAELDDHRHAGRSLADWAARRGRCSIASATGTCRRMESERPLCAAPAPSRLSSFRPGQCSSAPAVTSAAYGCREMAATSFSPSIRCWETIAVSSRWWTCRANRSA